jgi:hypothetical protein
MPRRDLFEQPVADSRTANTPKEIRREEVIRTPETVAPCFFAEVVATSRECDVARRKEDSLAQSNRATADAQLERRILLLSRRRPWVLLPTRPQLSILPRYMGST